VLVRVIVNVSAQDALKLNARQFAQSTTIRFCQNLLDWAGL